MATTYWRDPLHLLANGVIVVFWNVSPLRISLSTFPSPKWRRINIVQRDSITVRFWNLVLDEITHYNSDCPSVWFLGAKQFSGRQFITHIKETAVLFRLDHHMNIYFRTFCPNDRPGHRLINRCYNNSHWLGETRQSWWGPHVLRCVYYYDRTIDSCANWLH